MIRWALTGIYHVYCNRVLYVWAWTDIPTSLLLRYCFTPPHLRETYPERRGIAHQFRDKYLDAEWRSISQNEPGQTLAKTFFWPDHTPGRTVWFLFTQPTQKTVPASQSPLFTFTPLPDPTFDLVYVEPWTV